MQKFSRAWLCAVGLAAVLGMAGAARATPAAPAAPAIDRSAAQLDVVDRAAYVYRGRSYCWYPGGWNGPGWYRCGYSGRHGYGWGGANGWQGWYFGPPGPAPVHRRYYRYGHWHYY